MRRARTDSQPELETPGAGPSRPSSPSYRSQHANDQDARQEEEDRQFCALALRLCYRLAYPSVLKRRKEYLELEQSIKVCLLKHTIVYTGTDPLVERRAAFLTVLIPLNLPKRPIRRIWQGGRPSRPQLGH